MSFSSLFRFLEGLVFVIFAVGFLQGGTMVRNSPANAGITRDAGSILGQEEPLE